MQSRMLKRALGRSLARLGLLGLLLSLVGCARRWSGPFVEFPADAPTRTLTLPLRDPLLGPDLAIEAEVASAGSPARAQTSWFYVDSGSDIVSVPSALARTAGAKKIGEAHVSLIEGSEQADAVMLDELRVGELELHHAVATISDRHPAIIGQSILKHAPWEVAWDRGVLRLNAEPWPETTPSVTAIPLSPIAGFQTDSLSLQINGRAVRVALDTGSMISSLSSRFDGIFPHHDASAMYPQGRDAGGQHIDAFHLYYGDTRLGSLALGERRFARLVDQEVTLGTLGLDILSQYDLQVLPGAKLLLKARADLWQTASERVQRWPWTRACEHLGCVRARLERAGDDAQLTLTLDRAYPRPIKLLLACDGDPAPVISASDLMESGGQIRGQFHHLIARVQAGTSLELQSTVRLAGRLWFARPGACNDPVVLDVSPLESSERPSQPATAQVFL